MDAECVWTIEQWSEKSRVLQDKISKSGNDTKALQQVIAQAQLVLRSYSTSFYMVTRFLPYEKRKQVELIYAAVRYPDELVDTYALQGVAVLGELDRWERDYETALNTGGLCESNAKGLNPFVAAFAEVVKRNSIPPEYYHSFLAAMRSDLDTQSFATADELIDGYVYGSATVVGYFLTHVYGTERPEDFDRALACARDLAIALQLTNFARDIWDDYQRGRLYAPLETFEHSHAGELLEKVGDVPAVLQSARTWLAERARQKYAAASGNLHLFCRDSRVAVESCIKVYSLLNQRLLDSGHNLNERLSVPWHEKFAALPPSKYWRVPLAFSGLI